MRGTPFLSAIGLVHRRFIPAHAGNTTSATARRRAISVHPRACGEHSQSVSLKIVMCGSSPRMRGTLNLTAFGLECPRFIPAHAGNTRLRLSLRARLPVHPRACGEHSQSVSLKIVMCGSSPRMRGTLNLTAFGLECPRFIPAHAGNTRLRLSLRARLPVHPRACGEHCTKKSGHRAGDGSSPRMRGTRVVTQVLAVRYRFIPAHAGNTCLPGPFQSPASVHPRACGEHL